MDFRTLIRDRGGSIATSELISAGLTKRKLATLIAVGRLIRVRRGWVVLPGLDADQMLAAQHGATVSCVSAARRHELWVLHDDARHFAIRRGLHFDVPSAVVHWRRPLTLRRPGQLVDGIENVLDAVAHCLPQEQALAIWDSALQQKRIDYPALAALPFTGPAKLLLASCTPFSDSGLETMFCNRLRWMGIPMRQQAMVHGRRVDVLIGDRLVVQIDGRHHEGVQRSSDRLHDAELAKRGYYVIRLGYDQVVHDWHGTEALVLGLIARGLHLAR